MEASISKGPASEAGDSGAHQNIARTALVLDALAMAGKGGLRLMDVARITELNKTVAHRCLAGLLAHGLASYDQENSRFFLGDRIFAWASQAADRFELSGRVRPYLESLAAALEDTIYFVIRRGDYAVCYGRAEGAFPIKTLTLSVGDRRPLGVGSASLAIAAGLADEEVERLVREQSREREKFRFGDDMLRAEVKKARGAGFASMDGHLIPGMSGVAVPILDPAARPVASVSVAAIASRLEEPRRTEVVARLKAEAAAIERDLGTLLSDL
ncbi:DNA-binding IclR family transcriptional regulator [Caballeronia udeis]|uniref:DNA-binding IclR family transcriptional regulator n=1 Tax=Caballeronia udeis TaxID=1232866 RepID=A0ABW8MDV5_9BURK